MWYQNDKRLLDSGNYCDPPTDNYCGRRMLKCGWLIWPRKGKPFCTLGFKTVKVGDIDGAWWAPLIRPQSCKDSEVKK